MNPSSFPAGDDDVPASPLQALFGDVAGRARDGVLGVLISALGHVLQQQSWARARLRPHSGRTVRIALELPVAAGLPAAEALVTIDDDGLLRSASAGARPDASLLLKPSAAAASALMRNGTEGLKSHLRIEGDVALSSALGEVAQHLRWDAEEDLSRLIGDVAARRAAGFAAQGFALFRDLGRRAESAASQFLGSAEGPLTGRPELRSLRDEAAALEQRISALQARVARLGRSA